VNDRVTCGDCDSSFAPGTRFCGRCGASIDGRPVRSQAPSEGPPTAQPRPDAATRRRLARARAQARARRGRQPGNPVANFIFAIVITLAGFSTLATLCFGPAIVTAMAVSTFEYRPTGLELWLLWSALVLGVIIAGIVLVVLVVWTFGEVELSGLWTFAVLIWAYIAAAYFVFWPEIVRRSQVEAWPAEIGLTAFDVCTTRVDGLNGRGRLVLEIVNHATILLREVSFTVSKSRDVLGFGNLGQHLHRVEEWDIRPGERRRHAVDDLDLGEVKYQVWSRRTSSYSTVAASAELLWDHARFEGPTGPAVADRPPGTSLGIEPCPS
jgi:hypothetical protein